MRLHFAVEGRTEKTFVDSLLVPHFAARDIFADAMIVGTPPFRDSAPLRKGGGAWLYWERDIRRLLRQRGAEVRVTTLFDLYGLPKGFPGLAEHGADGNTLRRCASLEQELGKVFDDRRFIPYIQRHEFEALVLASLPSLEALLRTTEAQNGCLALRREISGQPPEDINDGKTTAPSKRLLARIPGYSKTLDGPDATTAAGLATLRQQCPRFDAWITRLEGIAG